ncbi:MAG: LamB/YcsF family protein [Actinomycetota bacterium]
MRFDLSTDVGAGGDDGPLYAIVSSVNIACGGYTGDREDMRLSVQLAVQHRVAIGALAGYAVPEGAVGASYEELARAVAVQVASLARIAEKRGSRIAHVRPQGNLYGRTAADATVAEAFVTAVWSIDPTLRIVGLAGSELPAIARGMGMDVVEEAFADLRYTDDGTPADPAEPGAVISNPDEAAAQALSIALGRAVDTIDDRAIAVRADTICIRNGAPESIEIARAVRDALAGAGLIIAPP